MRSAGGSNFKLGQRPALDGLRGLAIALVVLLHYSPAVPWLKPYAKGGFIGVEMFFVLSGFLITSIVIEESDAKGSVNLKAFYRRRAYRLIPALYLMVPLCIAIGAVLTIPRFGSTGKAVVVGAAALAYVFNLTTAVLPSQLPIWSQPLWSLCVEVHFYALWPPLLTFLAKRRTSAMAWCALGIIGASIAFRVVAFYTVGEPSHTILTPSRFDGLATGALAAIALHRGAQLSPRLRSVGVLGFAVLGLITIVARTDHAWMVIVGYTIVSLTTALMLVDALDARSATARILRFQPLRLLGEWSYALYLWHLPVYFILGTRIHNDAALVPLALASAVAVSAASSRFFEQPLRRHGQRRRTVRPVRATVAAADPATP